MLDTLKVGSQTIERQKKPEKKKEIMRLPVIEGQTKRRKDKNNNE